MARLGFHGKLPALGDFVSRGWSSPFCEALDRFVQAAMAAAYADTPASVLESQGRAVALAIRPGVWCQSGWLGLLMPSEDRVGRYFPICVGLETEAHDPPELLMPGWPSRRWTDELLERVLRVQVDGQGAQALMDALPQVASWGPGWSGGAARAEPASDRPAELRPDAAISGAGGLALALVGPWERLSEHQRSLALHAAAGARAQGVVMGEDGSHQTRFAEGAAMRVSAYAALFDGRWAAWGWALETVDDDTAVTNGDDLDTRPPGHDGIIQNRV